MPHSDDGIPHGTVGDSIDGTRYTTFGGRLISRSETMPYVMSPHSHSSTGSLSEGAITDFYEENSENLDNLPCCYSLYNGDLERPFNPTVPFVGRKYKLQKVHQKIVFSTFYY